MLVKVSNRNVLIFVVYIMNIAVSINGSTVIQLGEATAITCSAAVPVQSIQWLDESNSVVREGTSVQELALGITIAASHSNTEYTCRVSFHGGLTASDTITIRSNGKNHAALIFHQYSFYSYYYKCGSN